MGAPSQTDNEKVASEDKLSVKPPKGRFWWVKWLFLILFLIVLGAVAALVGFEMKTSTLQSREFSRYAADLTYYVDKGASPQISFPKDGPFDRRLGYVALPDIQQRLLQRGYEISKQVRFSDALFQYAQHGFYVPYTEKVQAGLTLHDCRAEPVYQYRYPGYHYPDFKSIPPLVVQSLLFIENRNLLSDKEPLANPAVDWPRFLKAAISQVGRKLEMQDTSAGGSTLATQVEKYRHSPDGLTSSPKEKLLQMISASVRAYRLGPQTLEARKLVAWAYLNSVPLSAAPGHGEVHGLGDGLWVWFGADPARVNMLLDPLRNENTTLEEQGLALRQVVALMIAHRRPSYYLAQGRNDLAALTDSYLRLFVQEGMIEPRLMAAALRTELKFRNFSASPAIIKVNSSKGLQVARSRLGRQLGVQLYDLDRMDLIADTSLNFDLQSQVTDYLHRLADPTYAAEVGLFGERLLSPEKTGDVRYSFTLFERGEDGFRVRVQTDNTDQPFDINEGSKLELGSTAKLRVLTTYLEIVAELHDRYFAMPVDMLRKQEVQDNLSRWAISWLMANEDRNLPAMLEAALDRKYSASPFEGFFTGGGMHTFNNFRKEDNDRLPTMRESLRESINLPFVRLLRDISRYSLYREGNRAELLRDDNDPRRMDYLKRFADQEGQTYLLRFWRKYQDKSADDRMDTFLDGLKPSAVRLAAVHRYLFPEASIEQFTDFLSQRLPKAMRNELGDKRIRQLYDSYGPGKYSLPDQGYVARVHPLELWMLGYLKHADKPTFSDAVVASRDERQEVYGWLFKTRHRSARDSRIRTMLEVESFLDIHQRWQRLGYPFDHLVPSLATALGSSGDRPAALAELMGIIMNDGVRLPSIRIDRLAFGEGTPFQTEFLPRPAAGVRVLPSEVATALRGALSQVVEAGTARRISGAFTLPDGSPLIMGGKTGTGDNRLETFGRGGSVVSSLARNRTATFVFYIGADHFGTLTAYVPGSESDKFRFTSALPVQVLKGMAPILTPYLQPGAHTECRAALAPVSEQ
ncbi:Membrane carboxypeptidase (penicillin-binding protein) [Aeromonas sp. RU39B]|uniref:transglycosylase domain-containing protein n=1 Tax=Aeromonas sp. RU39B TaxID=1907416 RepID=UPI00095474AA|nr:transglycosylase domain-containing protein [Aeromonas sp. RU39B]SIR60156.1 Membrane carboxypeptidase (penicillin-binding protein) [Aeromonas sp. RU39B]